MRLGKSSPIAKKCMARKKCRKEGEDDSVFC